MEQFFTRDYMIVWIVLLAALLFLPVRHLVWVLQVRRAQNKIGEIEAQEKLRLKRRAGFTASLICLLFSYLYVTSLLFSK